MKTAIKYAATGLSPLVLLVLLAQLGIFEKVRIPDDQEITVKAEAIEALDDRACRELEGQELDGFAALALERYLSRGAWLAYGYTVIPDSLSPEQIRDRHPYTVTELRSAKGFGIEEWRERFPDRADRMPTNVQAWTYSWYASQALCISAVSTWKKGEELQEIPLLIEEAEE